MHAPIRPLLLLLLVATAACRGEPAAAPPPAPGAAHLATGESAAPLPPAGCADPGAGPEPTAGRLRAYFRKRLGTLRDCYQRSLKRDDSAGGRATVRFTIGRCGRISDVAVVARAGNVDDAAACAARAMRRWQLPLRPASPVTVEYPVVFSASM